jgi:hypothetical protein
MMLHRGAGPEVEATPADTELATLPNTASSPPTDVAQDGVEDEDGHNEVRIVDIEITRTEDPSVTAQGKQRG